MRVVIADDSGIVRQGLARLLTDEGFVVVSDVDNAEDLIAEVSRLEPDVAIVDIRMPPTHTNEGLVAADRIRADWPTVGVLILSQHVEAQYALRLVQTGSGGVGYLLKDRVLDAGQLAGAVERIANGESVIDPELVKDLIDSSGQTSGLSSLTEREVDVLELMAEGMSDRGIADRLFVSGKTVETHVRHILTKLDLPVNTAENRRVLAVITYLLA
jgi:DNA-binding NarL/FixJ family response regulator